MRSWKFSKSLSSVMFLRKGSSVLIPGFDSCTATILPMNLCGSWRTPPVLMNRRAFCMRMRQYGLLKCHRGILCELFTFSTSICRLFSGAEWRVLSATFHKHVLYGIVVFLGWKWVYCSLAVALERTVFPFVKQCIEDKMAAECSYDLTFRAHFLSRRKRSVC